jgi:hypothetical protein
MGKIDHQHQDHEQRQTDEEDSETKQNIEMRIGKFDIYNENAGHKKGDRGRKAKYLRFILHALRYRSNSIKVSKISEGNIYY